MIKYKEGDKAPLFEGIDQDGSSHKLSDFSGKKLILFFYPKDMTPGCTAEACNLRDHFDELKAKGFELLGVSPDSVLRHKKFTEKYDLPFPLIADEEKEILTVYGVWAEKKMYGKTFMGVLRTTFIIDEEGIILKIFPKVKTKDHTAQILESLDI
ncbi:MAG: thioredoxin-dependent thiol peroxidase [Bacteroidetes bacterium]|nr:MAG: thioredoxin-dependent thiol peroxidase [Bacteroidota bacterium]